MGRRRALQLDNFGHKVDMFGDTLPSHERRRARIASAMVALGGYGRAIVLAVAAHFTAGRHRT
jgi:hypothetical protein